MPEQIKKSQSQLVTSVLTLDGHFADLQRLGEKIESLRMETDFDFDQVKRHMELFSKAGEGVSSEIVLFATALNEARAKAESMAQKVSEKAEVLRVREEQVQAKMSELQQLGDAVRTLTQSLGVIRPQEGETVTPEDRAKIEMKLSEVDLQLTGLIEKATELRKDAQSSKMKLVEQSADSLRQSLEAIHQKLVIFQVSDQPGH